MPLLAASSTVSSKSTYTARYLIVKRTEDWKVRTDPSRRPRVTVAAASNALRVFELLEIWSAINIYNKYPLDLLDTVRSWAGLLRHLYVHMRHRLNQILGCIARRILNYCPSKRCNVVRIGSLQWHWGLQVQHGKLGTRSGQILGCFSLYE